MELPDGLEHAEEAVNGNEEHDEYVEVQTEHWDGLDDEAAQL
jgi:hypothetical protein